MITRNTLASQGRKHGRYARPRGCLRRVRAGDELRRHHRRRAERALPSAGVFALRSAVYDRDLLSRALRLGRNRAAKGER